MSAVWNYTSDNGSESDSDSDVSCPNVYQRVETIQPVENPSNASEKPLCSCKRLYDKPCQLKIDSQKLSEYRKSISSITLMNLS